MLKKCSKCGLEKEKTEFHIQRSKPDGLTSQCKSCRKIGAKKSHEKLKNATKPDIKTKTCKHCKKELKIENFSKNSQRKDGYQSLCRKCYSDIRYKPNRKKILDGNKKWAEENREKSNNIKKKWLKNNKNKRTEAIKKYYKNNKENAHKSAARWKKNNPAKVLEMAHRRRARKNRATIYKFTSSQLKDRLSVFQNRCAYCGGPFDCIDHLKPLYLGGPHCLSNFRPSCTSCNSKKGCMPAKEWLKRVKNGDK